MHALDRSGFGTQQQLSAKSLRLFLSVLVHLGIFLLWLNLANVPLGHPLDKPVVNDLIDVPDEAPPPPLLPPARPKPSPHSGGSLSKIARAPRIDLKARPVPEMPTPSVVNVPAPIVPLPVAPVRGIADGANQGAVDGNGTGVGQGDGAGSGTGSGSGDKIYLVKDAEWAYRPTPEVLRTFYPARAWRRNVDGSVFLVCTLAADGAVQRCRAAQETPAAEGFAQAALSASRFFRIRPPSVNGRLVKGAQVLIPVTFSR
jgi:protein TonB